MLSPQLYEALVARFGDVRIVNENEPLEAAYEPDDYNPNRRRLVVAARGETYRVNCPLCSDTRQRLFINHRWNHYDPVTHSRNLFLAKCFNEDCAGAYEGRMELLRRIFNNDSLGFTEEAPLVAPRPPVEARAPGNIRPLAQLSAEHHARRFVESRGFDPDYLSRAYRVGYCESATTFAHALASNRLYIPVHQDGQLRGWQCRHLRDLDWKTVNTPKYFSMPGMPKRHLLYNHDQAAAHPDLLVVCEGPTDVWAVGENAVALFGKDISPPQLQLIRRSWDQATVVVLLDADARAAADVVAEKVGRTICGRVVRVDLPEGVDDPGSCAPEQLWAWIAAAVAAPASRRRSVGRAVGFRAH